MDDNLNYHSGGKTVFDDSVKDARFAEYRRQWQENPKNGTVSAFPLHLDIESTNACNLKCPHCASTCNNWGNSKIGFMDFDLFRKIIDEASKNGCYCVKFSLRGEPLLHPRIMDMIKHVSESRIIDFYFNTNGMLLNEKNIKSLIDSGLRRISISVDGWDKESFNRFRLGADYDVVCNNIKKIVSIRGQNKYPKIRVQTVMLPEMKPHWNSYKEKWSMIADEVGYLDAREEGEGHEERHKGVKCKEFRCPFLWQRMTILWDGTLLPCLMHGVSDVSLMAFGNVKELSIKDAWHSARETEYRELHRQGRSHEIKACDMCSYRAMEIAKVRSDVK